MSEDVVEAKRVMAISRTAALLAFAGAFTLAVLLVALHFIKPELDPSWHFISEYTIGRYGWMMVLAFLSLALGYVGLFVAIRSQLRTIIGRIGLALLLVSALGLIIAAVFTTDPITVSEDAVTTEGTLHNLAGRSASPCLSPPCLLAGIWLVTRRGLRQSGFSCGLPVWPWSPLWCPSSLWASCSRKVAANSAPTCRLDGQTGSKYWPTACG